MINEENETEKPEIWGGLECTINRIGDVFLDQLESGGFYNRPADLDAVISLGIKTLRYPVLWEKYQSLPDTEIDWSFAEGQLSKLKQHNVVPVVGLLHHGSGPSFTNLLQSDFPEKFAEYAAKVAAKFPWVCYYTPVNEPLTTARFSGLYGLWYPHKNNDVSFVKILLNEMKAVVLSMKEIRKVNPAAMLVQTEDLGKTYSTDLLQYQASFENHRRWLTYDILAGKLNEDHPLWKYFMRLGIKKDVLLFFIENPCLPDIIGVNYYLTSERYLDQNIKRYPPETRGGNTLHQYADVEAIRVNIPEPHGLEFLLKEIWERYRIPVVITEAYLNCVREEQMKWLHTVFNIAVKLRNENVDIRAVTAWSLLGSFGWNKLLTCTTCDYETGAFDTSAGYARPTALALMIRNLSQNKADKSHLVNLPGWWQRSSRYFKTRPVAETGADSLNLKPVIIIGKNGTLGKAFLKICIERNIPCRLLGRDAVDIGNTEDIQKIIVQYKPWAIINAAGYVNVDEAEHKKQQCYRENTSGVENLAIICEKHHIKLLSFSTDLVFDGAKGFPYVETDLPNALNIYGHSKLLAEQILAKQNPNALMVRTSAFFGPWDSYNFIHNCLSRIKSGESVHVANDIFVSPTYVPHLVNACLNLLIDDVSGIWHLVNKGCLTWFDFAVAAAIRAGEDTQKIIGVSEITTPARRPVFSALASEKYALMPSLEEALDHYFMHKYAVV